MKKRIFLVLVSLLMVLMILVACEALVPQGITGSGQTDLTNLVTSGTVDVGGTLNYGSNDLYPLGYASSGQQAVYGSSEITGTATAAHGLTTVTFALCTLGEDPTSSAGDSAMCTVSISSNVVTLDAWQDDFVTAATEVDTMIHWLVIGAP